MSKYKKMCRAAFLTCMLFFFFSPLALADGLGGLGGLNNQSEICGDGIVAGSEQCDDGARVSGDGCSGSCMFEYCGDYNITLTDTNAYYNFLTGGTVPEECDDGPSGTEDCVGPNQARGSNVNACVFTFCGDGIVQNTFGNHDGVVEECDDGTDGVLPDNGNDPNECRSDCTQPVCGDFIVDNIFGEACDAGPGGNATCGAVGSGDDCRILNSGTCGNGFWDNGLGEICDASAPQWNSTTCASDCTLTYCGDGVYQSTNGQGGQEQCDHGGASQFCDANCQAIIGTQTFDSALVCENTFVCGVEDGICPEDFYGVDCSAQGIRDIDCLRGSLTLLFDRANQADIISTISNSHGNIDNVNDVILNETYIATMTVSGPSNAETTTSIRFRQNPGSLSLILLDNKPLPDCGGSQRTTMCYRYDEFTQYLEIYHPLSTHVIQALFKVNSTPWISYFIIALLIAVLPAAIYITRRRQYLEDFDLYQEQLHHQVNIPHSSLDKLDRYIQRKLKQGIDREKIRNNLLNVGWDPRIVDLVMHRHHEPHQDLGRLKIFVHKMREKGHKNGEIRVMLKERGWENDDIEEALKEHDYTSD